VTPGNEAQQSDDGGRDEEEGSDHPPRADLVTLLAPHAEEHVGTASWIGGVGDDGLCTRARRRGQDIVHCHGVPFRIDWFFPPVDLDRHGNSARAG
jgi:hypothetical protein